MTKFAFLLLSLLIGCITNLCFAIPSPPPGADMIQFGSGFVSSSPPSASKRFIRPFTALGIAKAGTPLCNQATDCTYVWNERVVVDRTTNTGSGGGTINIVNNDTFPTLPPSDLVISFNYNEKLDFTTNPPTTVVTVLTKSGPVKFKEIIHFPIPASAFNGGCPTAFCYSTAGENLGESDIIPIGPDQEVFGYTTTRTYLIRLP